MALKFTVDTLEGLSEDVKAQYIEVDGKFNLDVSGIDTGDELKSTLKKERKRADDAELKLKKETKEKEDARQKALEDGQEFKTLYETEKDKNKMLSESVKTGKKKSYAESIVNTLTTDVKKAKLLKEQVIKGLDIDESGNVIVSGIPGISSPDEMKNHLTDEYAFLTDGSKANGGGSGGNDNEDSTGNKKTKQQFESLSDTERHKFIREGGIVTIKS